jgi:hypothetical protein
LPQLCVDVGRLSDPACRDATERVITAVMRVFEHANEFTGQAFEERYAFAKTELLGAMVQRRVAVEAADRMLDELSATRRLVEQCVKGAQLLAH